MRRSRHGPEPPDEVTAELVLMLDEFRLGSEMMDEIMSSLPGKTDADLTHLTPELIRETREAFGDLCDLLRRLAGRETPLGDGWEA